MEIDENKISAWYLVISEFLEAQVNDTESTDSEPLVIALCKVLVDAMEGIEATPQQKMELITKMMSHHMGVKEPMVISSAIQSRLN